MKKKNLNLHYSEILKMSLLIIELLRERELNFNEKSIEINLKNNNLKKRLELEKVYYVYENASKESQRFVSKIENLYSKLYTVDYKIHYSDELNNLLSLENPKELRKKINALNNKKIDSAVYFYHLFVKAESNLFDIDSLENKEKRKLICLK